MNLAGRHPGARARSEVVDFCARFCEELDQRGDVVRVDVHVVPSGAIGIHVGANARGRVFAARMGVTGKGSHGLDVG